MFLATVGGWASMRSGFLRSARRLWARRAISRMPPPSEELLARGGPLRAFLERRVGSEAGGLDAGSPQLAAAARLLNEKERELRDTESLLHDENEDLKKLAESEIALCQKEIAELKHRIISLLVPSEDMDGSDLILEVASDMHQPASEVQKPTDT
ncbi:peptide chain release factor 1-like, mitochondrial isoform X2 [Rattus norvegicus]|uniref:peptide chain release factor 1-like, mitochondrial isoform X2 n=1 Tax=Rattus norvegicus TaxID=10116 RepID=UPI002FD827BE